jgi:hypothetical protein
MGVNGGPGSFNMPQVPKAGNLLIAVEEHSWGGGAPGANSPWSMYSVGPGGSGLVPVVFYKYALGNETLTQTPEVNAGSQGWRFWELAGVQGNVAADIAAVTYTSPSAGALTAFTDVGLHTLNNNETVLVAIGGGNGIGYAVPTPMVQAGSGSLVADDNIGATSGIDGTSIVSGHYNYIKLANTFLQEQTSTANASSWDVAWIELNTKV